MANNHLIDVKLLPNLSIFNDIGLISSCEFLKNPKESILALCPISRNQPVSLSFMHLSSCKKDFDICYDN